MRARRPVPRLPAQRLLGEVVISFLTTFANPPSIRFDKKTNRWCNQLNPSVKRGPFTEEEDRQILAAHAIHGNKWAVISRSIPGR